MSNFNEFPIETNGLTNATLDHNHELPGRSLHEDDDRKVKGSKVTLRSINISVRRRIEKPRTKSKRIDFYYYTPFKNKRLRSLKGR